MDDRTPGFDPQPATADDDKRDVTAQSPYAADRATGSGGQAAPVDDPPRSPGNLVVIALFAVLLLAPAVLALTGHAGFDTDFIEHSELRHPFVAPPPSGGALATGGWQRDAEREIADAFPLRRRLIETYDHAKYALLHDVASTHVIKGRDGWLFLGDEERWYLTGEAHRPTDADLARLADIYAARSRWCAQHGMTFVYLLVPNKSTVYEDELPAGMQIARPTPADRLLPLLQARRVRFIDVRADLRALASTGGGAKAAGSAPGREGGELYSRGDTHWNDNGAYATYEAAARALRDAGVRDAVPHDAVRPRIETGDGDLLKLGGIASLVRNRIVRLDFPHRARTVAPPRYPNDAEASAFVSAAYEKDDPTLPAAVVFGDSFTDALAPFLAESFSRMVVLRHANVTDVQFDPHVLEAEKPRVVIQELVERSLVFAPDFKP